MEARLRSEPKKNGLEVISCFFYVNKRLMEIHGSVVALPLLTDGYGAL
jgi:hypothetical protein